MKPVLGVLVLAASLFGCAAAGINDRSPDEARDEISSLQRRILELSETLKLEAAPAERCKRMHAVATEICSCSDRICRLAVLLGDDASQRACVASREKCTRATTAATAGGCK